MSRRRWTDEQLIDAVRTSVSCAQVLAKLGLKSTGSGYYMLRHHIERLGLSTEHFTGQSWAKGYSFPGRNERTLEEVLVAGRPEDTKKLRQRLIRAGLKEEICEWCKTIAWLGNPVPLELDHIDGDRFNNRLESLRILCPNCHALTPTYCGKNIGRVVERHTRWP